MGRHQWNTEPGAHLAGSLESAPFLFPSSIWEQDSILVRQYSLNQGKVRCVEGGRVLHCLLGLVRVWGFPRQEQPSLRFEEQDLGGLVRNKIQERLKQSIQNIVHSQVLSQRQRRFPHRVGLRPGGFGQGQVPRDLLFRMFLRSNVQRGPNEPADPAFAIPDRKSSYPHPACFAIRRDDAEPFVKVSGLHGLSKLEENLNTVIRVDDLLIRERVLLEGGAGASGDGLVRGIYIESLSSLRINHPKDFLDVIRHLSEPSFTLHERSFGGIQGAGGLLLLVAQQQ